MSDNNCSPKESAPAAWMDPETRDVITAERKVEWINHYGDGGKKKAAGYTVALFFGTAPDIRAALDAPRRPLTMDRIDELWEALEHKAPIYLARAVEREHGIGGVKVPAPAGHILSPPTEEEVEAEERADDVAAAPAPQWRGLTKDEIDREVGELVELGTGFVAPLYAAVEGVERKLRERNAGAPPCGSHQCIAGQRDGVLCADGECDRENGVRPDGVLGEVPRG